jgi:hypothetical protein
MKRRARTFSGEFPPPPVLLAFHIQNEKSVTELGGVPCDRSDCLSMSGLSSIVLSGQEFHEDKLRRCHFTLVEIELILCSIVLSHFGLHLSDTEVRQLNGLTGEAFVGVCDL